MQHLHASMWDVIPLSGACADWSKQMIAIATVTYGVIGLWCMPQGTMHLYLQSCSTIPSCAGQSTEHNAMPWRFARNAQAILYAGVYMALGCYNI